MLENAADLSDALLQQVAARLSNEREAMLISRIRSRDRRAFQELYESYRPRLTRFLINMIKRPALVEEVVNETMMAVWEGLHSFKGESQLSTWVFSIAYRKGIRAIARNDDPVDDDICAGQSSREANPEQRAAAGQRQIALRDAIDGLSADHRAVIDLTYFHEMGYREIAVIMDCPVDTVKTRMFHARRHLKKSLSGDRTDWL